MSNTAQWGDYSFFGDPEIGWVTVNGTQDQHGVPTTGKVMDLQPSGSRSGAQRAQIASNRLNAIFGDSDRDLDFIIPIPDISGNYVVGCPLVRRGIGYTYFYGSNSDDPDGAGCSCGSLTANLDTRSHNGYTYPYVHEDMHLACAGTSNDPPGSDQELIATVTAADKLNGNYWESALDWANNIRARLLGQNAAGTSIQQLMSSGYPSPFSAKSGAINTEGNPRDITCCIADATGVIFHSQGLNTATNDSSLLQYWVKVSSDYTNKSVVVRVTDTSGSPVEVSYQVWRALGSPQSGNLHMESV